MTELIWEGKYQDGKCVAPLRVALPFQTVETVNESAQQRQRALDMFAAGRDLEWRNRLIWGDKKYVLPSLLPEFAGKVNLIYIDPPFNVGADFSFTATIPPASILRPAQDASHDSEEDSILSLSKDADDDDMLSFTKQPSMIEQKAYRDTWGRGLDSYLQWFYETVVMLRELLAEDGSIYVHLDWHIGHYAKAVLDEVFGANNFVNEIIWKRQTAKGGAFDSLAQYGRIHETIFFYSKSENYVWNPQYTGYDQEHLEKSYKHIESSTRRRYALRDLTAAGTRYGDSGKPIYIKGERIDLPSGRHWAIGLRESETVQEGVNRAVEQGKIGMNKAKCRA
jgi:16S rRNA G966 N2-methylase RsmD